MDHEELERKAMEALLAGDGPILEALRMQYSMATIERREFTGVGFFTHFIVQAHAPKVAPSDFVLADVRLLLNEETSADVMLFVHNGLMHVLEGVAHIGTWPNPVEQLSVNYLVRDRGSNSKFTTSNTRDLVAMRHLGHWQEK
jgi:hypothetical protein